MKYIKFDLHIIYYNNCQMDHTSRIITKHQEVLAYVTERYHTKRQLCTDVIYSDHAESDKCNEIVIIIKDHIIDTSLSSNSLPS